MQVYRVGIVNGTREGRTEVSVKARSHDDAQRAVQLDLSRFDDGSIVTGSQLMG